VKVFIFGAGVSKPAGFPLAKELMAELRAELDRETLVGQAETLAETWDRLYEDEIFRAQDDAELNFTRLQLRTRTIRSRARAEEPVDADGTLSLYQSLPMLIDASFMRLHEQISQEPERIGYLRDFVRRHVRAGDIIVTFNYDCLTELALHQEGRWGLRTGYGLDLADTYADLRGIADPTDCHVIKLHGSAGWISCFDRAVPGFRQGGLPNPEFEELLISQTLRQHFGLGHLEPHDPQTPRTAQQHVVLPTYLKSIWPYPLPVLWKKAGELLQSAQRVVVVGYSFPAADTPAQALLLGSIPRGGQIDFYTLGADNAHVRATEHFFALADLRFRDRVGRIESLAAADQLPLG
jgi:hypothetical protein